MSRVFLHSIIGAVYEDESAQLDSYRLNLALARAAEVRGAALAYRQVTGLVSDGPANPGRKDILRGHFLRRGGGGRRHLEPGLYSLAGLSRSRAAHEGRAPPAELSRRAPSRAD